MSTENRIATTTPTARAVTKASIAQRRAMLASLAATEFVAMHREEEAAKARRRLLAWIARIQAELDEVADGLLYGNLYAGALTETERSRLGATLDSARGDISRATPKTIPGELAHDLTGQ
ncbi:MAG: hypothetical protein C0467_27920 [Planctomycetaceae bacterium]|nr:hypothetical protein [Planctomycetaceae bacterium]